MSIQTLGRELRLLNSRMAGMRISLGLVGVRFKAAFEGVDPQTLAARELAFGQREAERDPLVQAICTTTNEGRCRVVVRRLGGWS